MEIRVLGHRLGVRDDDGAPIVISRRQVRELLCVLAIERGALVSAARLAELLWDPEDAHRTRGPKQVIYNARRVLPADRLRSKDGGYRLHLTDADYLDLSEFQQLTDQARSVHGTAPETAVELYRRALDLGGTAPLGDLPQTTGMEPIRQSLLGGLLDAREELAEALLRLHKFREVIDSVTLWLMEHPYSEHLVGLLMLAHYRSGRTAEALRVYREFLTLLGPRAKPGGWLNGVAVQISENRDDDWGPRPVHLATDEHRLTGGIDTTTPSPARVYDVLLGGKDNFAVDHEAAGRLTKRFPFAPQTARVNRAWVIRVVRFLLQAGVRQFIDLGSGLPTLENVHDVAQRKAPGSPVVYVDSDPLVCIYGRALLQQNQKVAMIEANAARPQEILEDPATQRLIDFDQPVAILLATVLHFISDRDDPSAAVRAYVEALPPGGYLAISHCTVPAERAEQAQAQTAPDIWGGSGIHPRDHDVIARYFDGLTLMEPGRLVDAPDWHPELAIDKVEKGLGNYWVGVGRKDTAPLTGA
ncbi:SAM-dependent methyltransferase [Actinomadura syzygii]|uniref:SAM-dependent methyltransferase n=1 Tax=Actinomadura syzygii TaxID=1427538 RepID=UPI001CA34CEA|nr:SAM-dependent methyltransferase [Actinomadura syzygii]